MDNDKDEQYIRDRYAFEHIAMCNSDDESCEITPSNGKYLKCPCCSRLLYCFKCVDPETKKKISYANRKLNKVKNPNVRPVGRPAGTIPKNKLSVEERKTRRKLNSLSKKINSLSIDEREQIKNLLIIS